MSSMVRRDFSSHTLTSWTMLLRMPCRIGIQLPLNWHMKWQAIISYDVHHYCHMLFGIVGEGC